MSDVAIAMAVRVVDMKYWPHVSLKPRIVERIEIEYDHRIEYFRSWKPSWSHKAWRAEWAIPSWQAHRALKWTSTVTDSTR